MNTSADPLARRFSLLDLIGLVAGLSIGLALGRGYFRAHLAEQPLNVIGAKEWALGCIPSLVMLTLLLWPLRLIPPRPRFRRRALLPGLVVSYVAAIAIVMAAARTCLERLVFRYGRFQPGGYHLVSLGERLGLHIVWAKDLIGPAVLASWLILWLGGGWRPERTWIDRAGRVLGWFWIALETVAWIQSQVVS